MDPKVVIYESESKSACFIWWAGVIGVVMTLVSIAYATVLVWPPQLDKNAQAKLFAMAAVWGVGGPMWFFIEYFFFYRKAGLVDTWDLFKQGQQVSAAIWAGLSVSFAALGSSDLAKPDTTRMFCDMPELAHSPPASQAKQVVLVSCKKAP